MKACRRAGRWLAHSSWPSPRAPPHTHPHTHTLCAQADTSCSLVWEGIRRQQDMRGQLAWITKVRVHGGAHGRAWGSMGAARAVGMDHKGLDAWEWEGGGGAHGCAWGGPSLSCPSAPSCCCPSPLPQELKTTRVRAARATQRLQEVASESGPLSELLTLRVPLPLDPRIMLTGGCPAVYCWCCS